MNESDVRREIDHALQWYGYWPEHNQDGRRYFCMHGHPIIVTAERKGYADLRAEHPWAKPVSHIEVKIVGKNEKAFRFDQIEPEQRNRMNKWVAKGGQGYLAIGKIVPLGKTRSRIDSICVLPWNWYLEHIEKGREKSIAWDWNLYQKRPATWDLRGSIVSFVPFYYWLTKTEDKDWQFSNAHSLVNGIVSESVPYYRQPKERRADEVSESEQVPASD